MATETEHERYYRYFRQNSGVFFASNTDMETWAKKMVEEGLLHPLSDIVPGGRMSTDHWYIDITITEPTQLLVYFNERGLNLLGYHLEHDIG